VTKYGLNKHLAYNKRVVPKGTILICTVCSRGYPYLPSSGHTTKRCNGCVVYQRKVRVKERLIAHLGGECVDCGFDGHSAGFHFHHEGEKDFGIARNYNRRFELLLAEVAKCILLCATCHSIRHARDV
jgi:hypothetical protein